MIYYSCALYYEAKPIIEYYGMKRASVAGRFQFFLSENRSAVMVITGAGTYNANAAVTMLCTLYPPKEKDIFVNFGSCGFFTKQDTCRDVPPCDNVGQIYVATGVKDGATGKSIYTDGDVLCRSDFSKCTLVTFPRVVSSRETVLNACNGNACLCDMEGYGAVFSASLFFETHRIIIIKAVSDIVGGNSLPNKEGLADITSKVSQAVIEYIERAAKVAEDFAGNSGKADFNEAEEKCISDFCEKLCFSVAMSEQLLIVLRRRKLLGKSMEAMLNDFEAGLGEEKITRQDAKKLLIRLKEYEKGHD